MTIMIIQEISIEHNFRAKSWGTMLSQKNAKWITYKKQTNKQTNKQITP